MRSSLWLLSMLAFASSMGCGPVEPEAPTPQSERVGLKPVDAADTLREMAKTMADAQQLTFKVRRHAEPGLLYAVSESADIEVLVFRPDKVRARTNSDTGVHQFYADGKRLSLFDETMNLYATMPIGGSIDEMVSQTDEKYGFTAPLAEFIVNDPYRAIGNHAQNSVYRGKETVNGVECHHVALVGPVADADVWVSASDQLPRKVVATFKDREGSPRLELNLSEWNLRPNLDPALFTFVPPEGAEKIRMVSTTEQASSASRKP